MDEINEDTGKYCFGINDTIYALESGAIDKLLCYQDLELYRVKLLKIILIKKRKLNFYQVQLEIL